MIERYNLIDHLGSIDESKIRKAAYNIAYKLAGKGDTYTLSDVVRMINNYRPNAEISQAQKSYFRNDLYPERVIVITDELTKPHESIIKRWAEKVDDLIIIEVYEGNGITEDRLDFNIIPFKDFMPGIFAQKDATDSRKRRCAAIWANALGWEFSAPLYRFKRPEAIENYQVRPDRKLMLKLQGNSDHISKVASSPESYRKAHAVASDEEVDAFWQHYKWLWSHNLLEESLEPNWKLCPVCGRPIRLDTRGEMLQCNYCDYDYKEEAVQEETYWADRPEHNIDTEKFPTFYNRRKGTSMSSTLAEYSGRDESESFD